MATERACARSPRSRAARERLRPSSWSPGRPRTAVNELAADAGRGRAGELPRVVAGDAHRPLRDAEEEVDGAVERVDDPAQARSCPATSPPSSPRIPSCGRRAASSARIGRLGGEVGLADEVGRASSSCATSALGRRAEALEQHRARRRARPRPRPRAARGGWASLTRRGRPAVGPRARGLELAAEREQRAPRRSGGRRAGRPAGGRRRRSRPGPTAAGCPIAFQTPCTAPCAAAALTVQSAPRPCSAPMRKRRPRGPGQSGARRRVVEDPVDARGQRGLVAAHPRHRPRPAPARRAGPSPRVRRSRRSRMRQRRRRRRGCPAGTASAGWGTRRGP